MSRLAISVTHSDGRTTRWGPDEPGAEDIPGDLTFSTSIPGGFKDLSCSLLRRIDVDHADQALFDDVRVYGPGNRTVWEGRMAQFPRSHGDSYSITPGAVGWAAHLKDDPSFREVYADRDYSRFGPTSLARRAQRAAAGNDMGKIQVTVGDGIVWDLPNESIPDEALSEIVYDAGAGLTIASIGYRGARTGPFTGFEAPTVLGFSDEAFTTGSVTTALTLDNSTRLASLSSSRRYVVLRAYLSGGPQTPAVGSQQRYDQIALYGNHGLSQAAIFGEPPGYHSHDIISDILTRAAPELSFSVSVTGSVETNTSFVIPHMVFADPVPAEDAISQVNAYFLYEWGVYDDRVFFWRAPDPDRLCWRASLADGAHLDLEGDTAEQIFNGVMVTYNDATGKKLTVGPTGGSFDATSSTLQDTSATNPVNAHSITRRWAKIDVSFPTTQAGATAIGVAWLAEHSLPQRRGTLTLKAGCVEHPTEGCVPVWRVRAGDYVRITDHPADVPRRIIETRYSHSDGSISLSLDNTSAKLDAILERIGVQMVGVF